MTFDLGSLKMHAVQINEFWIAWTYFEQTYCLTFGHWKMHAIQILNAKFFWTKIWLECYFVAKLRLNSLEKCSIFDAFLKWNGNLKIFGMLYNKMLWTGLFMLVKCSENSVKECFENYAKELMWNKSRKSREKKQKNAKERTWFEPGSHLIWTSNPDHLVTMNRG
jgi:hypothetical protein